ncbi:transmembrane protein 135-like protein [Leptotrombidium deliense]|uniref:Transmembrane protein 135-like protein n=1 Tax=Leptotrombidium deliense TaxID=299467 RepID=A0A443SBJ6_9ACAR|nr:transmembrane protein 135-like protein [Leptotrombidium deliense]
MPSVFSKLYYYIIAPDWNLPYNCYETGHTWTPYCSLAAFHISRDVIKESLKIYSSLYIASHLAFSRKYDRHAIVQLLKSILTSTAFLGFNAYAMFLIFCLTTKLFGKMYYGTIVYIPAFVASMMAIFIERPSRRGALAVYCANIASECLFNIAVKRKYFKPIPKGETVLFMASMSLLLYIIRKNGFGKDPISFAMKLILGRSEAKRSQRSVNRSAAALVDCDSKLLNKSNVVEMSTIEVNNVSLKEVMHLKHITCLHARESCLKYSFRGFLRPFLFAWVGQSLFQTLIKFDRFLKDPNIIFRALRNQKNINFGLFMGTFSGAFKLINCALRWYQNESNDWHAFVAAMIAGSSMLISRSSTIATYVAWKCIETLYCMAIKRGFALYPTATIAFVYAASVNVIFYTGVMMPNCLRLSYFKFIDRVSNHKLHFFNRSLLQVFEPEAVHGYEEFIPDLSPAHCSRKFLESVFVWMI